MTESVRLPSAPYPRPAAAWTLLATLFFSSILNTTDRAALNFLVDPIRHDLGVSDVQISLLQGLSFSIFYALAGLPLGLAADRISRVGLLSFGIALWSIATFFSGLAESYAWLFVCRMLVGFGEATLPPCSMSLISDSFIPARRGRSLSFYLLGGAISTGLAGLFVAWVLKEAPKGAFAFIPGAAGAAPWRIALMVAGSLGLLAALALLLQREPARRGLSLGGSRGPGLRRVIAYLRANVGVFAPLYMGFSAFSVAVYGAAAWAAPLLVRQFAQSAAAAGQGIGVAFVIAGVVGTLVAGQIVDHRRVLLSRSAKLTLLVILPLCMLPAGMATLAPGATSATIQLSILVVVGPMITIVMLGVLAEMMPNDMRGFSVALLGIAGSMIGGVLGPLLIATCTEKVFGDSRLVGLGILTVVTPALLLASAFFFLGRRALRRSLRDGSGLLAVMDADRSLTGERG